MRELHLFSGVGGGILGGILLGHTCVCAVEIEPYRRKVMLQRQRDGIFPKFPIWDDILAFDGKPWRGLVDVVCGGFPCQDISVGNTTAGIRGIDGKRSGLWKEMARVVCEVKPRYVFVENSAALAVRGLGGVLCDLAKMGFDARWGVFSAADVGALHLRERIWILADAHEERQQGGQRQLPEGHGARNINAALFSSRSFQRQDDEDDIPQPRCVRSTDAVANRSERLKAIGDGQVPDVVKLAWEMLK